MSYEIFCVENLVYYSGKFYERLSRGYFRIVLNSDHYDYIETSLNKTLEGEFVKQAEFRAQLSETEFDPESAVQLYNTWVKHES